MLPVPPLVELTAPLVLTQSVPVTVEVTLTAIAQLEFFATDPPVSWDRARPSRRGGRPPAGVAQPVRGLDDQTPLGNVSVNAAPDSATVLAAGLVSVDVSVLVPSTFTWVGLNTLAIDGAATTVKVAVAVFPVPPLVELTEPLVLFLSPAVVPVTLTTKVQLELAAIDPPVSETEPDPAVAVAVPPQLLLSPFGVATTNPVGKRVGECPRQIAPTCSRTG